MVIFTFTLTIHDKKASKIEHNYLSKRNVNKRIISNGHGIVGQIYPRDGRREKPCI